MLAALLVVGLAACGNKNATNTEDNNKVESEESAATEQVEEQEDRYAYLIPDSTGLFGMIPVHTFFAEWEKTENTKGYEDGQKVWRRHWEMVNEDFKFVKANVIPTKVEEGVAATVVEPFTITGISGSNIYTYSIYIDLAIKAVIKVDPSVDPKSLILIGYDKLYNMI
jgi:predicted small lipoprotein YifL